MKKIITFLFSLLLCSYGFAAEQVINLVVGYKTVHFAGKLRKAIAVNNQIPAPTLHFKEGDHVTINVYNHLDKGTSLHWHGILVPWQMDGVENLSQKSIPPGGVFHYQFVLKQSGTYWYHAHEELQEQQGLYGAFLIDPIKSPSYQYTKDFAVVLSDWINTKPEQVLANLKKTGDYYAPRFPLQPSLAKFIHDYKKGSTQERKNLISDYKMMQQMRMSIYDISDVAYDAFLLNGQPKSNPWKALVKKGDVVRLRFIGAGGGTIFHVKLPGTTMQMVHVQGNDVKPYTIKDLTVAPGETYDVLVKIQKNAPQIIYAESMDTVGAAYGALVTSTKQPVQYHKVTPFPEPLPVSRDMMTFMMGEMNQGSLPKATKTAHHAHAGHHMHSSMKMNSGMDMSSNMHMNHAQSMDMSMPTESSIIGDKLSPPSSTYKTSVGTKYQPMTAAVKTNDPNKPVYHVINMELFGYMDQFIWFINGTPAYKAHPIILEPNKRYRFVFTNTSMMHHPMHIHGHWFILRKGNDAYDPLVHTIDVPPGATITADVDTDASGQWFFHCHFLYHMMSAMSRMFQYSTLIEISKGDMKPQNIEKQTLYHNRPIVRVDEVRPIDRSLIEHPMVHPSGLWMASFIDIGADPFHNAQLLSYKGLYGPDYNKLELFVNDAELYKGSIENADIDVFYWHLISQFWAIKGGVNYTNQPADTPYWQPGVGVEGMMPYFIDTDLRSYYYSGSAKLDLELSRDTQITNNFLVRTSVRSILASKTVIKANIGNGLNQMRYTVMPYYRLMPGLDIFVEYEHEHDYGAFRTIQISKGETAIQDTISFGLNLLL